MPHVDGWAVLTHVRAEERLAGVRVIVLTAVEVEGLAVPVLHEPFSIVELLDLVAAVMGEPARPWVPG